MRYNLFWISIVFPAMMVRNNLHLILEGERRLNIMGAMQIVRDYTFRRLHI
jgi:hypothetical protein